MGHTDNVRFWETEHVHNFPWDTVSAGYWFRYPNQHSSHVFSVDTLETKIVDGKLYCKRLIIKTNPLPSWGKHFFSARRVPVIEECIVDPKHKEHIWYVRNIGLNKFMSTVEKARLTPSMVDIDKTRVQKQVWIGSSIYGFRSAIKKFGIDRYKKNSVLATEGFESVLVSKYSSQQENPQNSTDKNPPNQSENTWQSSSPPPPFSPSRRSNCSTPTTFSSTATFTTATSTRADIVPPGLKL